MYKSALVIKVVRVALSVAWCFAHCSDTFVLAGETAAEPKTIEAGTTSSDPAPDGQMLKDQAQILTDKAGDLQKKTRTYKAHASNYERTPLHSDATGKAPESAAVHAERMKALHTEYEHHVAMLRSLVKDYNVFITAYNQHQAQFRLACKQNSGLADQVEYSLENPSPQLAESAVGQKLISSEKQLAETLKKMNALEDQNLPESILCPAYDDLEKELARAITEVPAYIKMLPAEQAQVVAADEMHQLQTLKAEMAQANALHVEQLKLQSEYAKLRERYDEVSKQQAVVLKDKEEESAAAEK